MLGNMSDTVDKTEGYLSYDISAASSKELSNALSKLDDTVKKFDISSLSGDELASRVCERTGLTRYDATYATTKLSITGNVKASTGGYDAESDSSLLERYYEKLQLPNTGGNIAHFISLAKSYSGVGAVKVYPTWNGNNTAKLMIIDINKLPASADFINALQTYMDPLGANWGQGYGQAPYGAFTTVAAAAPKVINVSFTAVKDTNYSDAQRLSNFTTALTNYLASIAFSANAVSYTKIGAMIIDTPGFLDYSNLTVNGGTSNITLSYTASSTECPVMGTVTIS
jgi:uncharacterized phage protein gp47/JayE